MNGHDRQVDVVEKFVVELDGQTGAEEDHDFLVSILSQEREQKQKPFLRRTEHITLNI